MAVKWKSLERHENTIRHTFSVATDQNSEDLEALLERQTTATGGIEAQLALRDARTGTTLACTPVEAPCNWEDLSARFDPVRRCLDVHIKLLPPTAPDALLEAAAAATARVSLQSAGSPEPLDGMPAAAAATPAPPSSASIEGSLASSLFELPGTEAFEGGAEEVAPAAVAAGMKISADAVQPRPPSAGAAAPTTPHLTDNDASAAAGEAGQPEAAQPDANELPAAESSEAAGGEASAAAKKKKKKKKKKKAKAAGDGAAEGGQAEEDEEEEKEDVGSAADASQQQTPGMQEAAAEPAPALLANGPTLPEQPESPLRQQEEQAAPEQAADVAPAIPGRTELGKEVAHGPVSGPSVRDALSKDRKKDSGGGEDRWLLKRCNAWGLQGFEGEASFAAFGVFDGHGGSQAATFASNHLLQAVMAEVNASPLPPPQLPAVEGLSEEEAAVWRLQATLMARLPQACVSAFQAVDADARRRFPARGGTTATLALACGWELLVANVGDSCAYLDTGSEVLQVSGNHRLEDNRGEVERCLAAGHEVAPSAVEGKPAGPIRVWPGGLNMARTIGDAEAGDVVCAEPEVCQVTLPATGGRLLIGSDGLWDAVHPKTAAHHVRDMSVAEAAPKLLALAIKADRLKDDVTVVVVDFLPDPSSRLPPGLALHRGGAAAASSGGKAKGKVAHLAHVWHPMREAHDWLRADAERREAVLEEQRRAAAEAAAEAELARQRQRDNFETVLRKAARSGATADTLHEYEGLSELHRELLSLRLTEEDLRAEMGRAARQVEEEERAARRELESQDWETVGDSKAQQESAAPEAQPHGGRGGRHGGRGARGGRGRGGRGGRGFFGAAADVLPADGGSVPAPAPPAPAEAPSGQLTPDAGAPQSLPDGGGAPAAAHRPQRSPPGDRRSGAVLGRGRGGPGRGRGRGRSGPFAPPAGVAPASAEPPLGPRQQQTEAPRAAPPTQQPPQAPPPSSAPAKSAEQPGASHSAASPYVRASPSPRGQAGNPGSTAQQAPLGRPSAGGRGRGGRGSGRGPAPGPHGGRGTAHVAGGRGPVPPRGAAQPPCAPPAAADPRAPPQPAPPQQAAPPVKGNGGPPASHGPPPPSASHQPAGAGPGRSGPPAAGRAGGYSGRGRGRGRGALPARGVPPGRGSALTAPSASQPRAPPASAPPQAGP